MRASCKFPRGSISTPFSIRLRLPLHRHRYLHLPRGARVRPQVSPRAGRRARQRRLCKVAAPAPVPLAHEKQGDAGGVSAPSSARACKGREETHTRAHHHRPEMRQARGGMIWFREAKDRGRRARGPTVACVCVPVRKEGDRGTRARARQEAGEAECSLEASFVRRARREGEGGRNQAKLRSSSWGGGGDVPFCHAGCNGVSEGHPWPWALSS
jgi:hypothetical protein